MQDLPTFKWSDLSDKEEIGRGSFGSVFVAKYAPTIKDTGDGEGIGSLVVIKKLLGTEEDDKRLFLKEAKILHGLKSTNAVQLGNTRVYQRRNKRKESVFGLIHIYSSFT